MVPVYGAEINKKKVAIVPVHGAGKKMVAIVPVHGAGQGHGC